MSLFIAELSGRCPTPPPAHRGSALLLRLAPPPVTQWAWPSLSCLSGGPALPSAAHDGPGCPTPPGPRLQADPSVLHPLLTETSLCDLVPGPLLRELCPGTCVSCVLKHPATRPQQGAWNSKGPFLAGGTAAPPSRPSAEANLGPSNPACRVLPQELGRAWGEQENQAGGRARTSQRR